MDAVGAIGPAADAPARLAAARRVTALTFAQNGFVFGSWAPRIPEVQRALGLGEAELGVALLGVAAGALVAMPLAGPLAERLGSRRVSVAAALALGATLFLIPFASNQLRLAAALLLFGAAAGALDVAMNVQGSFVERRLARPIMSGLHGMFSLGGMVGAISAGAVAAAGVPLAAHYLLVALLTLAVATWAARQMLPGDGGGQRGSAFAWPPRVLLPLGLMAFTVLLGEGAMADWSAVYLTKGLGAGPATAAAGFAAFSLAMAAGRFTGDRLMARFGPVRLLRVGAILAALGLAGGLALGAPWSAVLGFGLVGAGLSCLFPVLIAVSTRVEGVAPGHAIAGIATLGYLGFLVGPPGIGLLAEYIGLGGALALVALLLLVNPILAGRAATRR